MPSLEVIVVTYGSWASASRELRAMTAIAGRTDAVSWCFVDNSPGGADAEHLQPLVTGLGHVRTMTLPNPGFATACNEAAGSSGADWVMFLNPDVLLDEASIGAVVDACHEGQSDTFAVSMVTDGRVHAGVGMLGGAWFVDASPSSPCLGPSGGAGVYRRDVFLDHSGFYPYFFAWGEDADLAWRLYRSGSKCQTLDLRLPHQGGHTSTSSVAAQQFKVELLYRNRVVVGKRNLPTPRFGAFVIAYAAAVVLMLPRNAGRRCAAASIRGFLRGLSDSSKNGFIDV